MLGYAGDFTSRLVDTSAPSPASLRLLWICRTPRQLRSASRGYVERPASFAPPLVDISNAPPASLRLSWICRTLRQLRSASCGYIERSASFAPPLVDMSNAPPASLRKAWQNRQADSGLPPLRSPFFNIQLVLRRMSDQELLQTLRILKPISRFEEFAPGW